jgi:hypothetical protein
MPYYRRPYQVDRPREHAKDADDNTHSPVQVSVTFRPWIPPPPPLTQAGWEGGAKRGQQPRANCSLPTRMWEVFHSVPKMRAMAVDAASYEELQALYHGGDVYRLTLWNLVCAFNNGTIHPAVADVMGDLFLVGIEKEKRDEDDNVVGTRPIGIPAALRRLSGRVLMAAYSECMGEFFTYLSIYLHYRRAA